MKLKLNLAALFLLFSAFSFTGCSKNYDEGVLEIHFSDDWNGKFVSYSLFNILHPETELISYSQAHHKIEGVIQEVFPTGSYNIKGNMTGGEHPFNVMFTIEKDKTTYLKLPEGDVWVK